jgi:hypothetical protein
MSTTGGTGTRPRLAHGPRGVLRGDNISFPDRLFGVIDHRRGADQPRWGSVGFEALAGRHRAQRGIHLIDRGTDWT